VIEVNIQRRDTGKRIRIAQGGDEVHCRDRSDY
jgi:hypothetical protein